METNSFGLERPLYTIADVINIVGLKRTSIYKYAKLGHLRLSKIGRKTVILLDDLVAFLIAIKNGKLK